MKFINCYWIVFVFCFIEIFTCFAQNPGQPCKTFYNNTGECVHSELCPPLHAIIKNKTRSRAATTLLAKSFCHKTIELVDGTQKYKVCCNFSDVNNGCKMPEVQNGFYEFIINDLNSSTGKVPWDTVITLKCAAGFVPKPTSTIYCRNNGEWSSQIECSGMCPQLNISSSVNSWCFDKNNNPISCNDPLLENTTVSFKCKPGYISENNEELQNVTCVVDKWNSSSPQCINLTLMSLEGLESSYESLCKNDPSCLSQIIKILIAKRKNILGDIDFNKCKADRGIINEAIIVLGGKYASGKNLKSIETYRADNKTWVQREVEIQREHYCSVYFEGKIFVIGGLAHEVLNTVESIDVKTWDKTILSPMKQHRSDFAAIALGEHIYVMGGQYLGTRTTQFYSLPSLVTLSSMERYDPSVGEWTLMPDMPTNRHGHGAVAIDDQIFVIGGTSFQGLLDVNECYSVFTRKWSTRKPMQKSRISFGIAAIDGLIYVVGGYHSFESVSYAERYDPKKDEWTYLEPTLDVRSNLAAVNFGGHLVISGGKGDRTDGTKVEQYVNSSWKALPSHKIPRQEHQMLVVPLDSLD